MFERIICTRLINAKGAINQGNNKSIADHEKLIQAKYRKEVDKD
jgi:hypothetical protein